MSSDRLRALRTERSALRLRLAAAALATSVLLLGEAARGEIASGLILYVLVAVALRYGAVRVRADALAMTGIAIDLAAIGAAVMLLPLALPVWALFLFPITIAALRFGPLGAAAAAAVAVVALDLAIALRISEAAAIQLWPFQLLVAAALAAAELTWTASRDAAEREALRRHALASADLAGAISVAQVLKIATDHLARIPGARGAWAWVGQEDAVRLEHERGDLPAAVRGQRLTARLPARGEVEDLERVVSGDRSRERSRALGGRSEALGVSGSVVGLSVEPPVALGLSTEPASGDQEQRRALVLDIANATARALARALERERTERTVMLLRDDLEEVRRLLRAREDAVATAVHELRTPLTTVGGYAQLMSRHLGTIQRQVGQLARLIADMQPLGLAQPMPGSGPTDLRELAREAVARVRILADAEVTLDVPDHPVVLTVDGPRIGQVVDNLLGNAVKYSPGTATIDVSLREEDSDVVLSVRDRGRGIGSEDLARIFERGYRAARDRDVRGEGLGLSVVRDVVEAHGGRVGASSAGEGAGSTFWIALPRAKREEPSQKEDAAVSEA